VSNLVSHIEEECRLRIFENRVLRRIFGPKRDEVTGEWRRIHNKELYALYHSLNIVRVINSTGQMGKTCITYEGDERCIKGFGEKICGKETTGKTQA
jgi:hypothetical protein